MFQQYFPRSYKAWISRRGPIALLGELVPLNCMNCGRDLLEARDATIGFVKSSGQRLRHIEDVYWVALRSARMPHYEQRFLALSETDHA